MKVLITGHNGFIGSNISTELKGKAELIGLGRKYYKRNPLNQCDIEYTTDLADNNNLKKIITNIDNLDTIIHCAATISWDSDKFDYIYINNVEVTKNLIELAISKNVKHFVFISAGARFGFSKNKNTFVTEHTSFIPGQNDPYAYSKYMAEKTLEEYKDKIKISIIYPSTVYGAGDIKNNTGTLIKLLTNNTIFFSFPGGTSYVEVRDLAKAVCLTLFSTNLDNFNKFIISAENIKYADLFNRITQATKNKKNVKFILPFWIKYFLLVGIKFLKYIPIKQKINFLNTHIIQGFFNYRYFSSKKANTILQWTPKYTLEDGVKSAEEFYARYS